MATSTSVLMKQYRDLVRNIHSFTNGQAMVKESEDCLENIFITFHIKEGLFRGAKIDFKINISDGFPTQPPNITCLTEIYHPNIEFFEDYGEEDGNVCLNLFDEHWSSDCTLEDAVQGLLFLIYNPNLADPLNSLFYGNENEEDFEKNVRLSLRGESVDGMSFPRSLLDDYESDVEEEEDEKTTVSTEVLDVLTEESVEPVATKQTVEQSESPPEDVAVPTENPTVVVDATINQRTRTNLRIFVRTMFSKVEKLFTGYAERQRTVVESSVDACPNNDVCVT